MYIIEVVNDHYRNYESIFNLVHYALHEKYPSHSMVTYYGGYNVDIDRAAEQMMRLKSYFRKTEGREMYHFVVSFDDRNIQPYDAWIMGIRIASYYGERYQIVFEVHEDTEHIHIHFVFNTVSVIDGKKYCNYKTDFCRLRAYIGKVYNEYMRK